jgi:hypothetical protein
MVAELSVLGQLRPCQKDRVQSHGAATTPESFREGRRSPSTGCEPGGPRAACSSGESRGPTVCDRRARGPALPRVARLGRLANHVQGRLAQLLAFSAGILVPSCFAHPMSEHEVDRAERLPGRCPSRQARGRRQSPVNLTCRLSPCCRTRWSVRAADPSPCGVHPCDRSHTRPRSPTGLCPDLVAALLSLKVHDLTNQYK